MTSELPRIISFFAVEVLLILLNIYFLWKLLSYLRYVKGESSLVLDWYLVSTFILLSVAILLRSILNIVIYVEELSFEGKGMKPIDDEKDFNNWFKMTYPGTYAAVEILLLVVLGIRNTSIIINLARWAVI
jgi:hypothetical protein